MFNIGAALEQRSAGGPLSRFVPAKSALLLSLMLAACSGDPGGAVPLRADPLEVAVDARETYATIVHASYADSLAAAEALDAALAALVGDPSEETLGDARQAWLDAREPYLQTEVYRFYDGPIDDPDTGPEGALNAWPLDENYIDYVEGDASAGIVNDPDQEISAEELAALNEQGGEKNIATGYHAVEFLLWGQDLDDEGPGARPYTDYVTDGSGTAENGDRRGEYLTAVSGLMLTQLGDLVAAWEDGTPGNYRAAFLAADPEESLRRILTGMIVLSGFETGGERLQAALLTRDQEDEHSCFSDNTHRDMIQDVQGVLNVWRGSYRRLDGSEVTGIGIDRVVEALDDDLAHELGRQIEESLELANALETPFDREITDENPGGRERVQALIDSLRTQENLLEDVFLGLGLQIPEPE